VQTVRLYKPVEDRTVLFGRIADPRMPYYEMEDNGFIGSGLLLDADLHPSVLRGFDSIIDQVG